jgi:DNA-binding NarL/FixJ family response regulator
MAKKPSTVRRGLRTSVIIVDEFPIFCEALGAVVAREEDLDYVGFATSAEDAIELVQKSTPDVAVIDVDLPSVDDIDFDGIGATRRIKDTRPETRVLILAARMNVDTMARAAGEGASGFLSKTSTLNDICAAIRTARAGGMFVERELVPPMVERLQSALRRPIEGGSAKVEITPREREVLTLLGEGLDVTNIARHLGITVNTARGHVKSLLLKLGSHSQLEAVVEAVHQGLLPHLAR